MRQQRGIHISGCTVCKPHGQQKLASDLGVQIKGYKDLLNPKLKGKIVSANPSNSSSAWDQLATMLVVMGGLGSEESWNYVEKFAQQLDGKISGSSSAPYKSVLNGEYVVGVTYEAPCIDYMKAGMGDKVELIYMEEGTTASFHGNGIIKDCKNLENAKLFMDHLIDDDTQKHMEKYGTHRQANLNLPTTVDFRPRWISSSSSIVTRSISQLTDRKLLPAGKQSGQSTANNITGILLRQDADFHLQTNIRYRWSGKQE